jgi:hypothetical protein
MMPVLLSVQIPIVDFRPLLGQDTGRHEQPAFPQPERVFSRSSAQHHRSSFVAGVGPVRPRLKGGAGPWASEGYYIDVSSLIRLRISKLPADSDIEYFRMARLPRPVYRNFHTDGVVGRLEIGFDYDETRVRGHAQMSIPDKWVLDAPTHLRGSRQEVPLLELGPAFARHLLVSTTRGKSETWWVQAGTQALLTEDTAEETAGPDPADDGRLSYQWRKYKGVRLLNWKVSHGDSSADEIRRLRIHLSRLHSDFTVFAVILARCQAGSLDPGFPPLERYLTRTTELLNRQSRHGFHQVGLIATALLPMQNAYSGVLESLAYLSRSLPYASPELRKRLDALQASLGSTDGLLQIRDLVINVNKNKTEISGGTIGAVSTGAGSAQGAVSTGAGNAQGQVINTAAADIGQLLESLVSEMAKLRPYLSDEDAALAEDTVDGVRRELDQPVGEQERTRITARLGRLVTLAATAGAAGSAVAGAIEAFRVALGL